MMKISGYSRQQLTRLIAQYRKTGRLRRRQRTVSGFKLKYSEQDKTLSHPLFRLIYGLENTQLKT